MRSAHIQASLRNLAVREELLSEQIQALGGQHASLSAALPQEPRTLESLPPEVLALVAVAVGTRPRLGKDAHPRELSLEEKAAADTLGYTEEVWGHGSEGSTSPWSWSKSWAELGAAGRSAALTLGYEQSSWAYEHEADPALFIEDYKPLGYVLLEGVFARRSAEARRARGLWTEGLSSHANFAAASKTCLAAAQGELYATKVKLHRGDLATEEADLEHIGDLRAIAHDEGHQQGVSWLLDALDAHEDRVDARVRALTAHEVEREALEEEATALEKHKAELQLKHEDTARLRERNVELRERNEELRGRTAEELRENNAELREEIAELREDMAELQLKHEAGVARRVEARREELEEAKAQLAHARELLRSASGV